MLSGLWFLPQVIRFSELGSVCILSMLSKCRLSISFYFIVSLLYCLYCYLLYIFTCIYLYFVTRGLHGRIAL